MNYQEFFSLANKKGIEKIQITEETEKENSIYLIDKKLEDYTDNEKKVYEIKAEIDGKTEKLLTGYLDETIIDLLLEKISETESKYEDEYLTKTKNNSIECTEVTDITEEIPKIYELEELKKNYPQAKSLEIQYCDAYNKTRIINNDGVDIATSSHNYQLYVEASAETEETIATYSDSILVNNKEEIDFEHIVKTALNLSTIATTKKKLETKRYDMVLSEKVSSYIIGKLREMLSAESIHKKKSCLDSKMNKKIFSKKITILEEPKNKKYPGYVSFDKEGTKTYNKELIKEGIIKTYLYDIKEAKIEKVESTGNKFDGISTRNMYLVPGEKSLDEIFQTMKNGIFITNYMGSSGTSVNCNNGEISLQVFGYIIEDGKIVCGFEPAILTTSIFELLSNVEEIGKELKFTSISVASPAIFIKNISVAGQ